MSDTAESEAPSDDLAVAPPAVEPVAKPSAVSRAADLISRRRETTITFVTVALFCYFWIANDAFVTTNNLRVVTQFATPVAFLAIAQVMNLVGGEIDLSLGNIYAFAPFVMISAQDWGLPLPVALVFAVFVASLVGLANGAITLMTGVPSFITTMGMLFFLNGVTLTISDAFPKTPTARRVRRVDRRRRLLRLLVGAGADGDLARLADENPLGCVHDRHGWQSDRCHARPGSRSSGSRSATSCSLPPSPGSPGSARGSGSTRSCRWPAAPTSCSWGSPPR